MMHVRIVFAFILFAFCSCADTTKTFDNGISINDTADLLRPDFVDRLTTSSNIFEFDSIVKMPTFQKWYIGIDSINFNDETATDTVVTFVRGIDTLIYAKANSGMFLWKMKLSSSKIVLDTNIAVSCRKNALRSKLNFDTIFNNILVSGEDASETFHFIFNHDTLVKIVYEMHFEAVN